MSPMRLRKKSDIFFPDEIIINILSWLPAENAFRCRVVCKRWRDLTSTLDFEHLHFRRSIPMILVSHPTHHANRLNHFLLDKWWEPERKRLVYHRFVVDSEYRDFYSDVYRELFSHGGLIVLQKSGSKHILIFNPTSHEKVSIILPNELWGSEIYDSQIYGVFFHPLLEEYCTLWRLAKHWRNPDACYKILNLGAKPCWRETSNPWNHRFKVWSTVVKSPVLIGECLYWLVEPEHENASSGRVDVMKFDIRSESFGLMHCPVPSNVSCVCSKINLLDIDGVLSFVVTSRKDYDERVDVTIWKLKDGTSQLWIPIKHCIRVKDPIYGYPEAVAVLGEQLVLLLESRLYLCNLKLGTARTFVKKKYNYPLVTFPHVMSLASLKNCKPRITMDKEGEVGEELDMA